MMRILAGNLVSIGASRAFQRALGMLLAIYAARYLGDVGYGQFSTALAVAGMVVMLVDFGFDLVVTREVARDISKAPTFLTGSLVLRVAAMTLFVVLVLLVSQWMSYSRTTKLAIVLLTLFLSIGSLAGGFVAVLQVLGKGLHIGVLESVASAAILGLGLYALRYGVLGLCLAYLGGSLLKLGLAGLLLRTLGIKPALSLPRGLLKFLLWDSGPVALANIFNLAYVSLGLVILSIFAAESQVGWFAASSKLLDMVAFAPSIVWFVVFPWFSRRYSENMEAFWEAGQRLTKYLAIIGFLAAIAIWHCAGIIVPAVYGQGYLAAVPNLRIMAWSAVPLFLAVTNGAMFYGSDRTRQMTLFALVTLCLAVLTSLLLVSPWGMSLGAEGAAYARVIAEGIGVLVGLCYMAVIFRSTAVLASLIRPTLSAAAVVAVSLALPFWASYLVLLGLVVIYFALLWVLGTFDAADKELLWHLVRRWVSKDAKHPALAASLSRPPLER